MYCIIKRLHGKKINYFDYTIIVKDIMINPNNYTFEFTDNMNEFAENHSDPAVLYDLNLWFGFYFDYADRALIINIDVVGPDHAEEISEEMKNFLLSVMRDINIKKILK